MRSSTFPLPVLGLVLWLSIALLATDRVATASDDRYVTLPIVSLDIQPEGGSRGLHSNWNRSGARSPYVVLDAPGGEAFIGTLTSRGAPRLHIAMRLPEGRQAKGRIYWPRVSGSSGMTIRRFKLGATSGSNSRQDFLRVKLSYYTALMQRDIPGAAWYRHQIHEIHTHLNSRFTLNTRTRQFFQSYPNNVESSFALLTGGRALSENLQLNRAIPTSRSALDKIEIAEIKGIDVREFDWTTYVKDIRPKLDRLAQAIPSDQHALFAPGFRATAEMLDQYTSYGSVVLSLATPRAVRSKVQSIYETQLGVSMQAALRSLGSDVVRSIAVTGGDPYFAEGTDVAVLMEARGSSQTLHDQLASMISRATSGEEQVKKRAGKRYGVPFQSWRNPARTVSSYLAVVDETVILANSRVQLDRVIKTIQRKTPSLASLDEYRYFRHRYSLGEKSESALLVISDATIRRWCGPRWRIGASRRTRGLATMTELQAEHFVALVKNDRGQRRSLPARERHHDAGLLTLENEGVRSNRFGTLSFQTPIAEQELTHVTSREAMFYRRWRDGYQRNWSNYFDPIAVRLMVSQERLFADVTVMPLIETTQYREYIGLSKGSKMAGNDGDPHPRAIVQAAVALNLRSPSLRSGVRSLKTLLRGVHTDPFAWLGNSVSVYADEDPIWSEIEKLGQSGVVGLALTRPDRLPIAIHADVKNGMHLTLFLAAMRAYLEQAAPGMTEWATREYRGHSYVRVGLTEKGRSQGIFDKMAVYYSVTGKSLVATLHEAMLKRSIDRQIARGQIKLVAADEPGSPATVRKSDERKRGKPNRTERNVTWLGENVNVHLSAKFLRVLNSLMAHQYNRQLQQLSWGNLPILNEWRRRFPDRDPVQLHARFWAQELVCPGGGTYRWNEKWQTMESTVFGHPGEPTTTIVIPAALEQVRYGRFGLTFEKDGLRGRVELMRGK